MGKQLLVGVLRHHDAQFWPTVRFTGHYPGSALQTVVQRALPGSRSLSRIGAFVRCVSIAVVEKMLSATLRQHVDDTS